MKKQDIKILRCAIYTRVSTEAGLEQDFNSLDAQREASEAYIKSQAHEGWKLVRTAYNDGGFSGGSLVRPALQKLLEDVKAKLIDVIVVYKVDRLTRSLADFAKLVELFDAHGVSFVSVILVDIQSDDGRGVALFANNLFDQKVRLENTLQETLPSAAFNRITTNQPLTVGLNPNFSL